MNVWRFGGTINRQQGPHKQNDSYQGDQRSLYRFISIADNVAGPEKFTRRSLLAAALISCIYLYLYVVYIYITTCKQCTYTRPRKREGALRKNLSREVVARGLLPLLHLELSHHAARIPARVQSGAAKRGCCCGCCCKSTIRRVRGRALAHKIRSQTQDKARAYCMPQRWQQQPLVRGSRNEEEEEEEIAVVQRIRKAATALSRGRVLLAAAELPALRSAKKQRWKFQHRDTHDVRQRRERGRVPGRGLSRGAPQSP